MAEKAPADSSHNTTQICVSVKKNCLFQIKFYITIFIIWYNWWTCCKLKISETLLLSSESSQDLDMITIWGTVCQEMRLKGECVTPLHRAILLDDSQNTWANFALKKNSDGMKTFKDVRSTFYVCSSRDVSVDKEFVNIHLFFILG